MQLKLLKEAQNEFYRQYPGGFNHPDMAAIDKKHKMGKMIEMSQEAFAESAFKDPDKTVEEMAKIIGRSSMISVFEKPKFKEFAARLDSNEKKKLSNGLQQFLYGSQEKGFNEMLALLSLGKLAKWSLITILPNYVKPEEEVFVKPTTAKSIISHFGIKDLVYAPTPTWDFYQRYRESILKMKSRVKKDLKPNNAAFCGFLMMTTQKS